MTDRAEAVADYELTMSMIRSAATMLEAAEPVMRDLIRQVDHVEAVGFVFDPTLARKVIHSDSIRRQCKIAQAVCDFMDTWRALRAEVLDEQIRETT